VPPATHSIRIIFIGLNFKYTFSADVFGIARLSNISAQHSKQKAQRLEFQIHNSALKSARDILDLIT
jgi:hypothetical protein